MTSLFRLLAAIVLLCDIEFEIIENNNNNSPYESVYIKNEIVLNKAADLLCIESDDLTTVLVSSNVTTSSMYINIIL